MTYLPKPCLEELQKHVGEKIVAFPKIKRILSKKWKEDEFFRQLAQKQHVDMTLNEIKHYCKNSKNENIAYKIQNFLKQLPVDSASLNLDEVNDSHFDSFGKKNLRDLNLPSANNSGSTTSTAKSNSNLSESKVRSPTKSRCEEDDKLCCVCPPPPKKKMTENRTFEYESYFVWLHLECVFVRK